MNLSKLQRDTQGTRDVEDNKEYPKTISVAWKTRRCIFDNELFLCVKVKRPRATAPFATIKIGLQTALHTSFFASHATNRNNKVTFIDAENCLLLLPLWVCTCVNDLENCRLLSPAASLSLRTTSDKLFTQRFCYDKFAHKISSIVSLIASRENETFVRFPFLFRPERLHDGGMHQNR